MRGRGPHSNNVGVLALSRETGYSAATISRKLSRGLSPDNIRSQARLVVAQERREARRGTDSRPRQTSVSRNALAELTNVPAMAVVKSGTAGEYEGVLAMQAMFDALEDAKLRRAKALAERQEIENMLRRGELMPISYARLWGVKFLIAAKDELLKGPSELQDAVAVETDPLKCAALMRAWAERTLGKFANLQELWAAPPKTN
jgi:hypothetical protein